MAIIYHISDQLLASSTRKVWKELPVKPNKTKQWLKSIAREYGQNIDRLNIIFCSDEELLQINRQFLSHDFYTDIITFDYSSPGWVHGELYISLDTVAENAKTYQVPLYVELYRVIAHGLLHLCGEKDASDTEKSLMRTAEDRALQNVLDYHIYL